MRTFLLVLPALLAAGCCRRQALEWDPIDPISMGEDDRVTLDLPAQIAGEGLSYSADAGDGVTAGIDEDGKLTLVPRQGFTGATSVTLVATDACDDRATTTIDVTVGQTGICPATLRYTARGSPAAVFVAGDWNDWSTTATPMTRDGDVWTATFDLPVGAHPYKLVENIGGTDTWACDPEATQAQCDAGYTWDPSCPLGGGGCNSLLVVEPCDATLTLDALTVDRAADTVTVSASASAPAGILFTTAMLDGEPIDGWDGATFSWNSGPLSDGRHTLRLGVVGKDQSEAWQYVPFWLDERDWRGGLMYFVFVDRFFDGDPSLDASEGTSDPSTDYRGGDWQGVIDKLDYLDSLGVTVLWLTAPQDDADGAWDGSCGATYSAYHGYWPVSPDGLEEHFGDADKLHELVEAAHARGMRVMTDWVANHVHEDHPWVTEHPDWFGPESLCEDADNWNDIPETCWFADYLPDLDYYEVEPLVASVDEALAFAEEYELDGYRVDAVKHMPHSVVFDLGGRAAAEIEHGNEDFYTVGETFSGDRSLIASYVGDGQLDGQFDFPLYWAIVQAFARDEIGLSNGAGSLEAEVAASKAAFGDHLMGTFLGNHDVTRFLAQASGQVGSLYGDGLCGDDGALRAPGTAPGSAEPYQRLMLAWSFLLTTEGLPLIYYGDEIGMPGLMDPDNRQMMRFDDDLSDNERTVLAHVRALGQARREHPAFSRGTTTQWWENEAGVWAYSRVEADDAVLVVLNRDASARSLSNGLAFADLPSGTYVDVLTGQTFTPVGDTLTVEVPALGSRVLVLR